MILNVNTFRDTDHTCTEGERFSLAIKIKTKLIKCKYNEIQKINKQDRDIYQQKKTFLKYNDPGFEILQLATNVAGY